MKSNGSMNRIYRVVWNAAKSVWQAVSEISGSAGKSHSESRRLRRALLTAGMLASGSAVAADILPTGGNVVAGSGTISQSGSAMTINQTTSNLAIDWRTFNIGHGNTVNFVQPSASAVAMNRVLGSDVSVIQGAINANGQVYLLNPNGILFTPTAQVNVGGIVASTLNMSTADFMAGNYKFEGTSSNAIINQGNITTAPGGTIALIAAKITNDGTLTADKGNVLLGAGSKVTLDMGGPVKLQIENDALETLIQNGGAIKADGGVVWLTSQAAKTLASSVINNTGLIEAQTLSTGEKGEIILFAHDGHIQVGGTIKAEGGFVETSGLTFEFYEDGVVRAGQWLIDPVDITIDQTLANAIQGQLGIGDVTISTAGSNTPDTSTGESSAGSPRGDIHFNGNLSWTTRRLVLRADNNIWIRGDLTGTSGATLGLEYGQAGVQDAGSNTTYNHASYTILGNVSLPNNSFYAKFGTDGTDTLTNIPKFLNNGNLRFGNGTRDSVLVSGMLDQPFYYDSTAKRWYKLTYSTMPLQVTLGAGGSGYADGTISFLTTSQAASGGNASFPAVTVDATGFSQGRGTLVATSNVTIGTDVVQMRHSYLLEDNKSFLKATTTITNNQLSAVSNFRFWTGTRDDFIGTNDGPMKTRGNLTSSGFVALTDTNQQAKALMVTDGTDSASPGVLFFSTLSTAQAAFSTASRTDNFSQFTPAASGTSGGPTDRSYALYANYGTLAANGGVAAMDWYYAAGSVGNLSTSVATSVNTAAAVTPTQAPTQVPTQVPTQAPAIAPVIAAATAAAQRPAEAPTTNHRNLSVLPQMPNTGLGTNNLNMSLSGGLAFVSAPPQVLAPSSTGGPSSSPSQTQSTSAPAPQESAGRDLSGFMRVFVVGGGITMPTIVASAPTVNVTPGNAQNTPAANTPSTVGGPRVFDGGNTGNTGGGGDAANTGVTRTGGENRNRNNQGVDRRRNER